MAANTSCAAIRAAPLKPKREGATLTHTSLTHSQRLTWKRNVKNWQLCLSGEVLAFAERDFTSWLCYTSEDTGDDGLIGRFRTLAAAKAYLERHAAFAIEPDSDVELCPL